MTPWPTVASVLADVDAIHFAAERAAEQTAEQVTEDRS